MFDIMARGSGGILERGVGLITWPKGGRSFEEGRFFEEMQYLRGLGLHGIVI